MDESFRRPLRDVGQCMHLVGDVDLDHAIGHSYCVSPLLVSKIYFSCFCSCQLKFREISYRLHSQGFGLKVQYQYMDSFRGNSSNSWFIEDVRFKASVKKVLHTCKNFAEIFFCRKIFPGLNRTFNMSVKLFSSSLTLSYPFCKIPMLPNIVLSCIVILLLSTSICFKKV